MWYFITTGLLAIWAVIREVKEAQEKAEKNNSDVEIDIGFLILIAAFIFFLAPIAIIIEIIRIATGLNDDKEETEKKTKAPST
jgi:TRAP-type mannitol/chloroaromatic compound transport system permease small subunit